MTQNIVRQTTKKNTRKYREKRYFEMELIEVYELHGNDLYEIREIDVEKKIHFIHQRFSFCL